MFSEAHQMKTFPRGERGSNDEITLQQSTLEMFTVAAARFEFCIAVSDNLDLKLLLLIVN